MRYRGRKNVLRSENSDVRKFYPEAGKKVRKKRKVWYSIKELRGHGEKAPELIIWRGFPKGRTEVVPQPPEEGRQRSVLETYRGSPRVAGSEG